MNIGTCVDRDKSIYTSGSLRWCCVGGEEFNWLLQYGHFDKAAEKAATYQTFLKKHEKDKERWNTYFITAYYRLAYLFFGQENYRTALVFINKIRNEFKYSVHPSVFLHTKILNILLHYELKNYRHLVYLINATQTFLKKRQDSPPFLSNLLYDLKEAAQLEQILTQKKWQILANSLDLPQNKVTLRFFDYKSWCESKVLGQSFDQKCNSNTIK